ncbi:MAG: zinc ribbon domain-containing protein [Actinomycetota bacterium]|nr:zinc ribbon domain-containing protein [Actinomycetota bacterium]
MICPDCGSYQPDRAKFCGICGSPLSQEGLVDSFLKEEAENDIELPSRRSILFYLAIVSLILVSLAFLGGAGYLVYRVGWGDKVGEENGGGVEDNNTEYVDTELGFSLSYPRIWTLAEEAPNEDELVSIRIYLSQAKELKLQAYQMDPVVLIGGMDGIEEFLVEDALQRITALGGREPDRGGTESTGEEPSYADGGTVPGIAEGETGSQSTSDELFTSTRIEDMPAYYTEFDGNYLGEDTEFILYYIVADDVLFVFQGRAPLDEYEEVRSQFIAMIGSFETQILGEPTAPGMPEISAIQLKTRGDMANL